MVQASSMTPEQQAKGMAAWMNWAKSCGNKLVDLGAPWINDRQMNVDGTVPDSVKNVSGFSIREAESMEEAEKLLKGHPHISGWHDQATIEVHETMPLPGM
jgi:hypothetical protein